MQKIGDITNTADSNGEYTNGNVAAGIPPTILESGWFNTVQREMINVLLKAGMKPDKTNDAQLSEAIRKLVSDSQVALTDSFGQSSSLAASQKLVTHANDNANRRLDKAQNGADIPDKAAFVRNLGLTAGSALPVGVPIPWPLAIPPAGWLKCNGSTFTAGQYPALEKVYPSLRLPDLRGEFIRGWSDDSKEVDVGRALLSSQADSFRAHDHRISAFDAWGLTVLKPNDRFGDALLSTDNAIEYGGDRNGKTNDKYQTGSEGENETRPRNIAFNYIVRAV
ncbi:phage tail protein [Xenorhabdus budapestensis]|uniref:phage tail protein n=1 Tax=Xenorhabdus budapestensis TaxID=290110 RepID=UPI003A8A1D99